MPWSCASCVADAAALAPFIPPFAAQAWDKENKPAEPDMPEGGDEEGEGDEEPEKDEL